MNEALEKAAEFIGQEKVKAAAKYAAAADLEILRYDPLTDLLHLSDGEAYSYPAFISWFCTPLN